MYDITDNTMQAYNPAPYSPPSPTIPVELPDYSAPVDTGGTSVPVAVSTGAANIASGISGVLGGVTATADTLLKAWGIINKAKTSAAQERLAVQTAQADLSLRSQQVSSAVELEKARSVAGVEIGRLQAQAAVSKAANEADAAKNGGVVYVAGGGGISLTTALGIAAVALGVWKLMKGGKK